MSRGDSRRVPQEEIDSVVKALYGEAESQDWEHLSPSQRTALYDKWVTEPAIGGVLTTYMSAETARSWIKDGPMKEHARARQGAGRYAKFGSVHGLTAAQVVTHVLGRDAEVVNGSIGVKPFHCLATAEGKTTFIAWGETRNFRYLIWAALNRIAEYAEDSGAVVITETMSNPTTAAEKARQTAIAKRCSLGLKYYRVANPRRPAIEGTP